MLSLADEGRAHLERVLVFPGRTDKHAIVAHGIYHIEGHGRPRGRGAVADPNIDSKEQACIADCPNTGTLASNPLKRAPSFWLTASTFSRIWSQSLTALASPSKSLATM